MSLQIADLFIKKKSQHVNMVSNCYIASKVAEDIEGLIVQLQQQDTWIWEGDTSGSYTVGNA